MEICSTTIFPSYDFKVPLNIVGVYRTPLVKHPTYEEALNKILSDHSSKKVTTIIAGDLNVTTWKKGYTEWIEQKELWELTNPAVPTFKKGTAPDAMLMALGEYIPEDLLLDNNIDEDDTELRDSFPAYISEEPILGDHMALFLAFQTQWPQVAKGVRKYDVKSLNKKEWQKYNNEITENLMGKITTKKI